ncbi:hypothetical protein AK88_02096 [Plasmodium fragile]|uniref:Schizont-infected cell agglutination extracellular alpha domain-containing protein n=1 Tax=Plasmodium fragile TaxID=5857 RepID=A0A0D9QMK8_PLAFR|nr:uncharacterized protein AK88_02096 [Plasmodium fragile]KJP88315.1 hypothetical protein AK88_02096 [Plasmodium fragile]
MSAQELGDILAQYVRDRQLYGNDDAYQASLDKDIGDMLGEFIQHMETMESLMEEMGTNCNNYGWQHWEDQAALRPRVGHTVGDRITCKFMTTAILFMRKGSLSTLKDEGATENNKKIRQYIRCAIVNMFATILTESACGGQWGIYYAWYSVDKMMDEGGMRHLITADHCQMGVTEDIRRGQWKMSDKIKNWLRAHEALMTKIKGTTMSDSCNKSAQGSTKGKDGRSQGEGASTVREGEESALNKLKEGMKSILQRAQEEVVQSANRSTPPVKDVQRIAPMTEPAAPKLQEHPISSTTTQETPVPTVEVCGSHDGSDERTVRSVGHCVDERTVQRRGDECGGFTEFMDTRGLYVDSVLQKS